MKFTFAVAALAVAVVPALAQAQFAKPDDAVEYRQSALFLLGNHFGRMGAVVKGDAPFNKDDVAKNAELVASLSKLPWPAFEGGQTTAKSKAKPEVFSDKVKFQQAAEKMETAVAKLNTVAKGGDLASIKTAFGEAAQTCKSCHDGFRAK
ncbi:c-type cytochrome [Pandoraea communis]|uniref:Cytochrome C n=1 Tax=Pandoraea communis TaxID=2508297 RepID=A0A5E4Y2L9_9BURK|nr:cytochrome c [Pandoraea communis]MDM8358447.1 cytochrome c [Pandoraea communis]VVE42884.1 cytochrome C [Pandoraea communis]